MFDVDNNWIYGKNKNWITRFELKRTKYSLPVVSGVTTNNGVNYYTDDVPKLEDIFKDSLTISTRGEYSGTVTYHKGKFLLANNILVMQMPKLTLNQKLFIGSLINNLSYGGYDGYPRKETLKEDKIQLPTKNGEIDFEFMESFVSQLEAQHIAELEAYLTVTGLKDCELTEEEEQVIENFEQINWQEKNIIDVFYVKNTRNILSNAVIPNSGRTPYLCASAENNGVYSYISYDETYIDKGNCIFIGGKTFVVTYQENDFYSNDSHNLALYLKNNDTRTKGNQLYIITCIIKSLKNNYSWGNSISNKKIRNDRIMLPVTYGEVDFCNMETLISAIQKLVIKDVILFSDKKIETTEKLIGKTNI